MDETGKCAHVYCKHLCKVSFRNSEGQLKYKQSHKGATFYAAF